ncbi:methyltransferase domain-containing protein [Ramlibacter henchirensis]|jgi:phosphatidylethanolamine/phosphatidyl-N-methylethanolamine N-methyltransferase|uniref:Methyltransferase domain-containing protein n=1 Tax=Ramlibacter henchirensis TaxID=204072 RepID=A0A4Z0BJ88_9BURK|nr:methyltransferase domain-containing protein [Ramlibacter henchirensis]TFY99392.1 methyltransferase domain-containing protein [Ramlibacter henchirensis]
MALQDPRAGPGAGENVLPAGSLSSGPLRDRLEFLRGFLRHPAQVGSVVPSSHRLEQRLVRSAAIAQARTVVELGPGTGGTTAAMLQAMPATARLLAVELDPNFHQHLQQQLDDPRLLLELGSAERLADFLAARRLPAPDAIVSGIPFSTMPPEVSDRIAAVIAQVLRPGGRFVAYQVRAHVADYASRYLGAPDKRWEVVNIPPVRVFTWVKPGDPSQAA